jgi:acetyl/propionyl-CoA carboxylase alpha subunit
MKVENKVKEEINGIDLVKKKIRVEEPIKINQFGFKKEKIKKKNV